MWNAYCIEVEGDRRPVEGAEPEPGWPYQVVGTGSDRMASYQFDEQLVCQ